MSTQHMPQIGKLGFGVAGPLASRLFPAQQTEQLIEKAIECGVSFFDTGPSYGGGEGERRLGAVLAQNNRKKLFISTKAGVTEHGKRDFAPASLYDSLRRSLDRMQLEYVDGLFLHGLTRSDFSDQLLQILHQMKSEGLVRRLGVVGQKRVMDFIIEGYPQFELLMLQLSPSLWAKNIEIAAAAKLAGRTVVGIEMLAHTRRSLRLSSHPGDIWHMLRYLRRGGTYSKEDALSVLRAALVNPYVDLVLTSSTKIKHVEDWQSCLDECSASS